MVQAMCFEGRRVASRRGDTKGHAYARARARHWSCPYGIGPALSGTEGVESQNALQVRTKESFPQDWAASLAGGATSVERLSGTEGAERLRDAVTLAYVLLRGPWPNGRRRQPARTLRNSVTAYQNARLRASSVLARA